MERLEFDLLFRWFVGLGVDDPVSDASTFSKNRDRLLAGEVAQRFLAELLALPEVKRLLSKPAFSVDGTLLQAWASLKSFRRKDGSDAPPGPGATASETSRARSARTRPMPAPPHPDARLYRKGNGQPAELCYIGHALMENRNGLIVGGVVTPATGDAEPLAAIELVKAKASARQVTLGADKAYDTANFVMECREEKVTPHVAKHHLDPRLAHRWPHHPPPRLCGLASHPQADRGGLRLGEGDRRARPGQAARPGPGRLCLRPRPRRLQPGAAAEFSDGRPRLSAPHELSSDRPVADRRGRHLGCGPAMLDIRATDTARSPSAPSRPASTSPMAIRTSLSIGQGSTRWTRSEAPGRPNSSKTAPGDRVRSPSRRRGNPQSRTSDFFSNLLGNGPDSDEHFWVCSTRKETEGAMKGRVYVDEPLRLPRETDHGDYGRRRQGLMLEWLLAPIDPSRPDVVGLAISWHARIMVLAWEFLVPLALSWRDFSRSCRDRTGRASSTTRRGGAGIGLILSRPVPGAAAIALPPKVTPITRPMANWCSRSTTPPPTPPSSTKTASGF